MLFRIVLLLFILCLSTTAQAATYYASPTGSGTTCSDSVPCSRSTGMSTVQPGDTLILKNGNYVGEFSTVKAGTSNTNRITIKAETDLGVRFSLNSTCGTTTGNLANINHNWLTIRGIEWDFCKFAGTNGGIRIGTTSAITGIIFEYNWVHDTQASGIHYSNGSNNIIIRHNKVEDTGHRQHWGECNYISDANNVQIYNNLFHGCTENGVDGKPNSFNFLIHHNIFEDQIPADEQSPELGCGGCDGSRGTRTHGTIRTENGLNSDIYDNVMRNNDLGSFGAISCTQDRRNVHFHQNVIYDTITTDSSIFTVCGSGGTSTRNEFDNNTACGLQSYSFGGSGSWNAHTNSLNVAQSLCDAEVNRIVGQPSIASGGCEIGTFASNIVVCTWENIVHAPLSGADNADFAITYTGASQTEVSTVAIGNMTHTTMAAAPLPTDTVVVNVTPGAVTNSANIGGIVGGINGTNASHQETATNNVVAGQTPSGHVISDTGDIQSPVMWDGSNTPNTGCGTTYYFDNVAGSDGLSCTGSEANACKSMSKFSTFTYSAGNCIRFKCNSTWTDEDPNFAAEASGSSGNPISYGAYGCTAGSERPKWVFTSSGVTENFDGISWINLDRLQCEGCDTWRFRSGANNINVTNIYRKNDRNAAFTVWHGTPTPTNNILFENIEVDGAGPLTGLVSGTGEVFYIGGGSDPGTIDGITVRNFYGTNAANEVVSVKTNATNILVENGLIEGNRRADDPGFINTSNATPGSVITIRNVVVRDNGNDKGGTHPAVFLGEGTTAYNLIVHNNAGAYGYRGVATSKILHSIFYQNGQSFLDPNNTTPDANIKNNIAVTNISGNIDPAGVFADAANDRFRHCNGCTGIDQFSGCQGVTVDIEGNTRPQNTLCDAGAFEDTVGSTDPSSTEFWAGLIAYWTLNSTLAPIIGSNTLLYSGASPSYVTGQYGNAIRFNGSDFASVGVHTLTHATGTTKLYPTSGQSWTVAAWFKTLGTGTVIASAVDLAADRDFQIAIATTRLDLYMAGAITATTGDYNDGTWHHIAVTWDGSSEQGNYYIDGDMEQGPLIIGTSPEDTLEPIIIGARTSGAGYRCGDSVNACDIDDVRIYRRALSASEIDALYNWGGTLPIPGAPTDLSISPITATHFDLSWQLSTGSPIEAYHIEFCTGDSCSTWSELDTTTAPPFSATGLTSEVLYRFRVRARDVLNQFSAYSNIAEGTPTEMVGIAVWSGGILTGGILGGQ